jgi:hypothetical protein
LIAGDILNLVDFKNYSVKSCRINTFPNQRDPSQTIYLAGLITTSSQVVQSVADVQTLMLSHQQQARQGTIDLNLIGNPCAGAGRKLQSGWDLVNCAQSQQRLLNYMYENSGGILTFSQQIANQLNIFRHEVGLTNVTSKTSLLFPLSDGSSLVLTFSYTISSGGSVTSAVYVIDFEKSTDAEGNPLKIGGTGSGGDGGSYFTNGSSSLASFLEAAGRAGITVGWVEESYDIGSVKCTMSSNGSRLTCHFSSK